MSTIKNENNKRKNNKAPNENEEQTNDAGNEENVLKIARLELTMEKEEEDEEEKLPGVFGQKKMFWKMGRPKYGVFNFQCDMCRDRNSKLANIMRFKVYETGSKGEYVFAHCQFYCEKCVQVNFEITDLMMKNSGKQKNNFMNFWQK